MSEIQKVLMRFKNERDIHYRNAADNRIKGEVMDMVVMRLEAAIEDMEAQDGQDGI